MTHHESPDAIRPECLAKMDAMHETLKRIDKALLGNGDSDKGLIARVAAHGLALKIIGTAVGILVAAALTAVLAGCGAPAGPANSATPVAAAAPEITARDVKEIKSSIEQVQTTVQTTSYALDAERAAVMKADLRRQEKRAAQVTAVLVGLVILMAVAPAFLPANLTWLGYIVGIAIVAAAVALPLLWPF